MFVAYKQTVNRIRKALYRSLWNLEQKLIGILFLILAGFGIWVLFETFYFFYGFDVFDWFRSLPYVYPLFRYVFDEIASQSQIGLYYLFAFSSLFVFPVPLELVYLGYLRHGMEFWPLYVITLIGIITGQHINYFTGRMFRWLLRGFISKRSRERIKERLHKYGIYAIFLMHAFPLPYPFFNFVVGVLRYPYSKWLYTMLPGLLLNYFLIYYVYLNFLS